MASPFIENLLAQRPNYRGFDVSTANPYMRAIAEPMLAQQTVMSKQAMDNLRAAQSSGSATAASRLAQRGGLTGGARERIQQQSLRDLIYGTQKQGASDMAAQLGILGQAQGQALNLTQQESAQKRAYDLERYKTFAQAQASEREAQATENAGSLFICTALRERGLMTREESKQMTRFFLRSIVSRPDFYLWYFKNGHRIIEANEKKKAISWEDAKVSFVDSTLKILKRSGLKEAQKRYAINVSLFNNMLDEPAGKMPSKILEPLTFGNVFQIIKVLKQPAVRKLGFRYLKSAFVGGL